MAMLVVHSINYLHPSLDVQLAWTKFKISPISVMILKVRRRTGLQNRKAQTKFGASDEKPLLSSSMGS